MADAIFFKLPFASDETLGNILDADGCSHVNFTDDVSSSRLLSSEGAMMHQYEPAIPSCSKTEAGSSCNLYNITYTTLNTISSITDFITAISLASVLSHSTWNCRWRRWRKFQTHSTQPLCLKILRCCGGYSTIFDRRRRSMRSENFQVQDPQPTLQSPTNPILLCSIHTKVTRTYRSFQSVAWPYNLVYVGVMAYSLDHPVPNFSQPSVPETLQPYGTIMVPPFLRQSHHNNSQYRPCRSVGPPLHRWI